ncbi:phospholipase D family protein [Brachybacterium huguangmaarense]
MAIHEWFLTAAERDNPFTRLTHRRGGLAYSSGNRARAVIHGVDYFARLRAVIDAQGYGDLLLFTDWRGDADERLDGTDATVADVICAAARRGVIVRALFWRSHLDAIHYSESENRDFADLVRRAGGEVVLDQRVPPMGCHHQKFVVARHPGAPERDVAFVGGIDLCHTRRDDARHHGDPQTVSMGAVWGDTPAWHDMMIEVHGPAVGDVEANFRERWEDPTSPVLDPVNRLDALIHRDDTHPRPLPPQLPDPEPQGTCHVQVLRTFPPKLPRFPFAPSGERSVAHGYVKASRRAQSLVYIEDQYVWNAEVMACFTEALRVRPELHMVIVLSTYTTADTTVANASAMTARDEALSALREAGGDRVSVYGIENEHGTPIYVHAKVCVIDDVWMTIGSDNLNLRSWTYDSELTCAVIDEEADERAPRTLRDDADPARALPRATRLELAREHLGLPEAGDDAADGDGVDRAGSSASARLDALADPQAFVDAFRESAAALDAWHAGGKAGPRPAGHLRTYAMTDMATFSRTDRLLGRAVYRMADDPDGRPLALRGTATF